MATSSHVNGIGRTFRVARATRATSHSYSSACTSPHAPQHAASAGFARIFAARKRPSDAARPPRGRPAVRYVARGVAAVLGSVCDASQAGGVRLGLHVLAVLLRDVRSRPSAACVRSGARRAASAARTRRAGGGGVPNAHAGRGVELHATAARGGTLLQRADHPCAGRMRPRHRAERPRALSQLEARNRRGVRRHALLRRRSAERDARVAPRRELRARGSQDRRPSPRLARRTRATRAEEAKPRARHVVDGRGPSADGVMERTRAIRGPRSKQARLA
mmetsp:Transcript_8360/g.52128  ORF Transcript_8360/g.52128 Transcript_8360/m.52128 type:complete len:277 (-) Transcript_8360:4646-5476(-)